MKYKKFAEKVIFKNPILFVLFGYFLLAFYKLDEIPGEWFGDIDILHEYVLSILSRGWPWNYSLSAGPFYHYLITPLILVIGQNYLQYKVASVIVGAVGVYFTYLMAKELAGEKIALMSAVVSSISFWTIVWTRLGNSQVVIPFLVAIVIYSAEKYSKNNNPWYWATGMFFASMGLFTYPQTFVLPLLFLLWLIFNKKHKIVVISILTFLPAILSFLHVYNLQKDNFTTGYVGSKVPKIEQFYKITTYKEMGIRIIRTLGMFHLKGEEGFRTNVSNSPHIDLLSGIFLLVGLVYWYKKDRKTLYIFLIAFLIIIIPSCSPSLNLRETPNNGRTIGVLPIVYTIIASGIYLLFEKIKGKNNKRLYLIGVLSIIGFLNLYKYFVTYPNNLPNKNVAFGKIISDYIDNLPINTKVILTSCCWGEWGQAEPKAIYYDLKNREGRENIVTGRLTGNVCHPEERNVVYIFNPNDHLLIKRFEECFSQGTIETYEKKGQKVFSAMYIK